MGKEGLPALKKRCEELAVQPRGTRGESVGFDGCTYDVSNKHRLGYSEVQLIQVMIDGVNTLWKEDLELQKKARPLNVTSLCYHSLTLWAFSMFWTSSLKNDRGFRYLLLSIVFRLCSKRTYLC